MLLKRLAVVAVEEVAAAAAAVEPKDMAVERHMDDQVVALQVVVLEAVDSPKNDAGMSYNLRRCRCNAVASGAPSTMARPGSHGETNITICPSASGP